jgi:hypothetical protein
MTGESDPFPQRLDLALNALSQRQQERLLERARTAGNPVGGIRGAVSALAGMKMPSFLSDMVAGRVPGHRYREILSGLLEVDLAWLTGDDSRAPDWALPPLDAWERFSFRIMDHWRRINGGRQGHPDDTSQDLRGAPADEQRIARMLDLRLGSVDPGRLAAGRLVDCDLAVVLRFALQLGLPEPTHPEHLARGQEIARVVDQRLQSQSRTLRRRYNRFYLPPRLFNLTRIALIGQKAQRIHQGKDVTPVDDTLEILWRQQLLRSGQPRLTIPRDFTVDTGRTAWTPLSQLQARYAAKTDPREDDPLSG